MHTTFQRLTIIGLNLVFWVGVIVLVKFCGF